MKLKRILKALLALVALIGVLLGGGYLLLQRDDIPYEQLEAKYADSESKFVDLSNGVRMHYRDQGNRQGPALLLLHGFAVNMTTWDAWLGALGQNYRLISIDLPGHGLTRAPASYAPSIASFADLSAELATKLGVARYTVIGSSMGGHTAWMMALRHPENVAGLVLVAAGGWFETNPGQPRPLAFRIAGNPTIAPVLASLDISPLMKSGLKAAFPDKSRVTDEMVARYSDFSLAPGHRGILKSILGQRPNPEAVASKEKLAAIEVPTLIIWGEEDEIVPVANAKKFQDALPSASVLLYPGVGHLPQEEVPQKSVRDLQEYLATVLPAAPSVL